MFLVRSGSREKLRYALKDTQREFNAAEKMPADLGITGNTFRAYSKCGTSPSAVYRKWAISQGFSLIEQHDVHDRKSFQALHKKLLESLVKYWNKEASRDLSFAERHKIVDLFVKAVSFHSGHSCEKARIGLYHYGNIPLDKFSLLAISDLFYGIVVSPAPSMGHIRDQQTYNFLQNQIFLLTQAENLPNLVFDHYAWNLKH